MTTTIQTARILPGTVTIHGLSQIGGVHHFYIEGGHDCASYCDSPSVLTFDGMRFVKTGYNSDKGIVFYTESTKFARF